MTRINDWKPDEGFVSLFNGKDLTGWKGLPLKDKRALVVGAVDDERRPDHGAQVNEDRAP